MTATAVNAKDVKKSKDALVASFFESSKAAQEASTATVNFFNAIEQPLPGDIAGIAKLARAVGDVDYSVAGAQSTSQKRAAAAAAKKARDPNAPKKPLTMYFAYSALARKEIMEERARKGSPPLSSSEMTHETSKKWKDLPSEERDEWKRKYNEELELYQHEKDRYIDDLISTGAEIPEEYQKAAHTRKRKIEFANASNSLKHPKLEHHAIADAVGSVADDSGVVNDGVHSDNEEDVAAAASAAVAAAAAAVEDAVSESDGEKRSKKEKKKKKKEKKHDRERERD